MKNYKTSSKRPRPKLCLKGVPKAVRALRVPNTPSPHLTLFAGNMTRYGRKFLDFLAQNSRDYKVGMGVETHVPDSQVPEEASKLSKAGWTGCFAGAQSKGGHCQARRHAIAVLCGRPAP